MYERGITKEPEHNIAWYTHSIFARECVFAAHNLFTEIVIVTTLFIFKNKKVHNIETSLIAFM